MDRVNLDAQRAEDRRRDGRAQKIAKFRRAWEEADREQRAAFAELRAARTKATAMDERERRAARAFEGLRIAQGARPGDVLRVVAETAEYWVQFENETAHGFSGRVWHERPGRWAKNLTNFSYHTIDRATGENVRTRRRSGGGANESPALFAGGES